MKGAIYNLFNPKPIFSASISIANKVHPHYLLPLKHPPKMACGSTSATTTWSMSSLKKALPSITASHSAPAQFSTGSSSLASSAQLKISHFKRTSRQLSPFLGLTPLSPLIALTCPELKNSGHRFSKIGKGFRVYAMRHGRKVPKLNRPPDQRKALLRGLTTQLFKHGRIVTTEARAKAMRKYADKMITLAKDGSLHKRRQALGFIYEKQLVHALFAEAQERYGERNGGYTTILKMPMNRRGDNAPLAVVQLL